MKNDYTEDSMRKQENIISTENISGFLQIVKCHFLFPSYSDTMTAWLLFKQGDIDRSHSGISFALTNESLCLSWICSIKPNAFYD